MTDRKQEVIAILHESRYEEYRRGKDSLVGYPSPIETEALYNRIAPLMVREFPREAYQEIISDSWCRGHNYVAAPSRKEPDWEDTSDLLDKAERIWGGQEPQESDHIAEVHKKVCSKCGGSGKARTMEAPFGICPNCDGTGEIIERPYLRKYASVHNADERKGNERRKVESARRIHPDRRKAGPG